MTLVYALPGWLGLIIITLLCVGLACGGHILVRRTFASRDFIPHNEVAGFIIAVVGVLYAVLLGFLTVIVWEHYSQAEEQAKAEVDAATDVWRFGNFLPPTLAARIRSDVDEYAVVVAHDEWPKMQRGQNSSQAQKLILRLFGDIVSIPVDTRKGSNLQNQLFGRVQTVADLRRTRINDNESTLPPVVKLGLIMGACAIIGFLYLFGLQNFRVQLLMTGLTAAMIGILMGLILLLDYPFRGDVSVSPDRWVNLHEAIEQDR